MQTVKHVKMITQTLDWKILGGHCYLNQIYQEHTRLDYKYAFISVCMRKMNLISKACFFHLDF